jgi:hypothetical protein
MKLTALFILASVAMAEAPPPKSLSDVDALRLEVVSLRLELAQRDRNEVIKDICTAAQVPLQQCAVNAATRTVSAIPAKESK